VYLALKMGLTKGQILQKGKKYEYTVGGELDRERFWITYQAERSDGEPYVIKILNSSELNALNSEERNRLEKIFWEEAVKLAKCSEIPHIVKSETPFTEDSILCLPMEYLGKGSSATRVQRQLLESNALEYIYQIGEALAIVHEKDLVHCDIRPANIFLRLWDGQIDAVLTDFGLALSCDAELTRTRAKERSEGFSPIELYSHGQPVGPYTDVYSLAATLYEFLTGEVPMSSIERQLKGEKLMFPQGKNQDISRKTTNAILKGMELLPYKRPQSVKDWLKQLPRTSPAGTKKIGDNVDWPKWQTYLSASGVVVALAGVLVTLLVGIPAWLTWQQQQLEKNSTSTMPPPTPTTSATPSQIPAKALLDSKKPSPKAVLK
jgi:eukaryotic-like serine/threonine-protein kinase